jgi:hypothetical protein
VVLILQYLTLILDKNLEKLGSFWIFSYLCGIALAYLWAAGGLIL